jgi:hypothetical protein
MSKDNNRQENTDFILYIAPDGDVKIDVLFDDESVWLTQKKMANLFNVDRTVISKHLSNIFDSEELEKESNVQKLHVDNSKKPVSFYNLDVIISVGYRVNSRQATQFRVWATKRLRNYLIKGFAIDEDRLKNGSRFGKDYFAELLEKIREIRASERRFYLKITDIYATAIDYDKNAQVTRDFFARVQNKLHFAIHGQTSSELISNSADADKEHMGLKIWKNAPKGKILKSDVAVGKNYLEEAELKELNRVVGMYLDYAENQAERQISMKMEDWAQRLDVFLEFNEYDILDNAGQVSAKVAKKLAHEEFEKFRPIQDENYVSDFEEEVKKIKEKDHDSDE